MEIVHALKQFMIDHIAMTFWLIIVFVLASTTGSYLPAPKDESPMWYVIFYSLTHGLAMNFARLWYTALPVVKAKLGIKNGNGGGNGINTPTPDGKG